MAIVASGPSLTAGQVETVRGRARLIVINSSWRLAPWADLLYACDDAWWRSDPEALSFPGVKLTQDERTAERHRGRVARVVSQAAPGLSFEDGLIHTGGNSGFQALNVAVQAGANPILLLGFDMGASPTGKKHWHADHPPGLNNPGDINFAYWRTAFESAVPDLERAGVQVWNCTPGSALDCFTKMTLDEALSRC